MRIPGLVKTPRRALRARCRVCGADIAAGKVWNRTLLPLRRLVGLCDRRQRRSHMAGTAAADAIWKDMQTRGVEFLFAQFVDMYARPSAKLVPVLRTSTASSRRAPGSPGSPRARSGRCRATRTSRRSRISTASRPFPGSRTSPASRVTSRSRARAGRTVRARSCGASSRGRGEGVRVQHGSRARVLPRPAARRRLDRDRRPVRHAREALLRHGRPHAALRLPDDGLAVLQRPRAGATTRTTTRMRTASSSRTSRTTTRSSRATARSSSATWCTRSPSSTG